MHQYIFKFTITIGFVLPFLLNSCTNSKENELNNALSLKTDSLNILKSKFDSILAKNDSLSREFNYWFSDEEVAALKEKNINDPIKDISNKLYDNPKLIPYPGVLGGTMRFNNITLLKDRWVIADFDDGHIMRAVLLKYSVQKDTSLKWTVIDKYLD